MNIKLVTEILLFSLIPVITMIVGGILGTAFNVNQKIRSSLLHLAAGVIFAVVAIDILPNIVEKQNVITTSIGFFAGLAVMLLIKHLTRKSELKHKETIIIEKKKNKPVNLLPWGLLVGIAVDIVLDGILLGVGFAAGKSEGVLLCIALSLEILVLGLVVSTELKTEKFNKKLILTVISLLTISIVSGAFIGSVLLNIAGENSLNGVLAFGLSALMYLVTEELLVEAHENIDTPFSTAIFFIGFFIFLIIALIY
jgi:ZIP family zinc transporter